MDHPHTCRMQEIETNQGEEGLLEQKEIKRQNFKDKKQAFIQAKAAYEACLGADSDDDRDSMDSDNDEGQGVRNGDQNHLMQPNSLY